MRYYIITYKFMRSARSIYEHCPDLEFITQRAKITMTNGRTYTGVVYKVNSLSDLKYLSEVVDGQLKIDFENKIIEVLK